MSILIRNHTEVLQKRHLPVPLYIKMTREHIFFFTQQRYNRSTTMILTFYHSLHIPTPLCRILQTQSCLWLWCLHLLLVTLIKYISKHSSRFLIYTPLKISIELFWKTRPVQDSIQLRVVFYALQSKKHDVISYCLTSVLLVFCVCFSGNLE